MGYGLVAYQTETLQVVLLVSCSTDESLLQHWHSCGLNCCLVEKKGQHEKLIERLKTSIMCYFPTCAPEKVPRKRKLSEFRANLGPKCPETFVYKNRKHTGLKQVELEIFLYPFHLHQVLGQFEKDITHNLKTV